MKINLMLIITAAASFMACQRVLANLPNLPVPQNVTASQGTYTNKIRVTWDKVEDYQGGYTVYGYAIYRTTTLEAPNVSVNMAYNIGSDNTTFDDKSPGLEPETTYYYWIRAYNNLSLPAEGWMSLGLAAPQNVNASDGVSDKILVSWDAVADADGYHVYRAVNTADVANAALIATVAGAVEYSDESAGLMMNKNYYYWVKAKLGSHGTSSSAFSAADRGWIMGTVVNDYDGDAKSDIVLYDQNAGGWLIFMSDSDYAPTDFMFGGAGYLPVIGDYDGDTLADPAVYRQSTCDFIVLLSGSQYQPSGFTLGNGAGVPVSIDYDGDRKVDPTVYAGGWWQILLSGSSYSPQLVNLGEAEDSPAPADYDGDSLGDIAVYDSLTGTFTVMLSSLEYWMVAMTFGNGFIPAAADYDYDGKADFAGYDESAGEWRARFSSLAYLTMQAVFGGEGWLPVPADYDGDGKCDVVIYNPQTGIMRILLSGSYYAFMEFDLGTAGSGFIPVGYNWLW